MNDIDALIWNLAKQQHGVVARRQMRAGKMDPGAIRRRVASGALERLSSRTFRVAGVPATTASTMMAGVLDAGSGAVVSHGSAAAMWGGPGFDHLPLEVTGRRGRVTHEDPHLATVHQPRRLLDCHVVELDHIPVTTPSRTVFDLAGSRRLHPLRLARLLDTFWARNLVCHASLLRMMSELAARGRPGIGLMRELMAARPSDHRPPGSNAESRFQELAHNAGLTNFVRQLDVGDDDRWIGRIDFLDRERRLIVEVQSALYHGSLTDRLADQVRHAHLRATGWAVVAIEGDDLFRRPTVVVRQLRQLARSLPTELVES